MPNQFVPKNAVQAKYLFERATVAWEPNRDFSNGLVVCLLQDAMELMVWGIAKSTDATVGEKEFFGDLIKRKFSPDNKPLHGTGFAFEINKARIDFKHYGRTPSRADIPRLIDETRYFLQRNAEDSLGINFDEISLADDVGDQRMRQLLKDAEKARDTSDLKEALISASLAFQELASIGRSRSSGFSARLDDVCQLFPRESQQAAYEKFAFLDLAIEKFFDDYALLSLGVNGTLRDELLRRVWHVNVSQSGIRLGVVITNGAEPTLENVNYLISTLTEIGRRLSPHLPQN